MHIKYLLSITIFKASLHKNSYKKKKSLKRFILRIFIKIKEEKRFLYIAININISMFIRLFEMLKITHIRVYFNSYKGYF